jgi:hypothetical protein
MLGQINDVTVTGTALVQLTGVSATGAVGDVFIALNSVIPVVSPTPAAGAVGNVSINGDANVALTGVAAVASVGDVLVYGNIIPDVNTLWVEIQP